MLTDNEILNATGDKLNFKAYAEAIKETIKETDTPLTIGIHGDWGSGKTSLMKIIDSLIENDKNLKSVWFNAWKYDKAQDLRVALINSILRKIEEDSQANENLLTKVKDLIKRVNWYGLGSKALTIGTMALGASFGALPFIQGLSFLKEASKAIKNQVDFKDIIPNEVFKKKDSANQLELIGEFESKFQEIVNLYINEKDLGEEGKLLIFIDDLDRCLPDKALDILESIKLFLNINKTVFVIGTDKRIIETGILDRYGKNSIEWCREYIEKIIQVPFRIPPNSRKDIESFINELNINSEVSAYTNYISAVGNNPRKVKRLINNFELQKKLSEMRKIDNMNFKVLAKLNVLEFRWPDFFEDFLNLFDDQGVNLFEIMNEYYIADEEKKKKIKSINENYNVYFNKPTLIDFIANNDPKLYDINNIIDYIFITNSTKVVDKTWNSADYDDQKGKWGNSPESNDRVLNAKVSPYSNKNFKIDLKVISKDEVKSPLSGTVTFYLHHTFKTNPRTVNVKDGNASLTLYAYGAFTVGVEADNGKTKLELDLAELTDAPTKFREN